MVVGASGVPGLHVQNHVILVDSLEPAPVQTHYLRMVDHNALGIVSRPGIVILTDVQVC